MFKAVCFLLGDTFFRFLPASADISSVVTPSTVRRSRAGEQ